MLPLLTSKVPTLNRLSLPRFLRLYVYNFTINTEGYFVRHLISIPERNNRYTPVLSKYQYECIFRLGRSMQVEDLIRIQHLFRSKHFRKNIPPSSHAEALRKINGAKIMG